MSFESLFRRKNWICLLPIKYSLFVLITIVIIINNLINLALCTGRSYTNFSPIKWVIANELWVYCSSPMFSKTCTFLCFYILSHLLNFWNNSPPLPIPHFFPSPNPISTNLIRNIKPSLIFELSLGVLFSAVMLCL